MTYTITFTHRGWFGLCPVFIARLDSPAPVCDPRHWSLFWLFWLSEWMFGLCIFCLEVINPYFVPSWPIKVTGKLHPPRVEVVDDNDDEDTGLPLFF